VYSLPVRGERGDGVEVVRPEAFLGESRADEVGVVADRGGDSVPGVGYALRGIGDRLHGGQGQFVADAVCVGEPDRFVTRLSRVDEADVRAAPQRVGDADHVVVGI
jgi:hypothetical protein